MVLYSEIVALGDGIAPSLLLLSEASIQTVLSALSILRDEGVWGDYEGNEDAIDALISKAEDEVMGHMIGMVMAYTGQSMPSNFLLCDGATYPKASYPLLWDVLPNALKTETTLSVPDLRGRFVLGVGSNGANAVGDSGGQATVTLGIEQMPSHSHEDTPHVHQYGYPTINIDIEGAGVPDIAGAGNPPVTFLTSPESINILPTGGGQAHENMPPWYALVYVVVAR